MARIETIRHIVDNDGKLWRTVSFRRATHGEFFIRDGVVKKRTLYEPTQHQYQIVKPVENTVTQEESNSFGGDSGWRA